MADGQVIFEISGDNRSVKEALDDTTRAIETEGKKWDKAADESSKGIEDKIVSMFKKISAAAVASKVGQALLDFGKDALQAASDLQEVQNVVDVVFGSDASKIEKWAREAGTQFGLTETQAKKFTSTIGALAKSAGLAGPEIVDMSTDIAGLAADMASFYNLDFEEAFQKLRSGIAGEQEPLKQLGINMSAANLEAFALKQGITQAFDSMSQGEQTMLRYQYLMQATADAQGDFARTSDGYANAVRALQTNIDSLKTSIGSVILPIVGEVVKGISDMVTAMQQPKPQRTVLDEFAEIDLKTAEKLAEIQKTVDDANALIGVLEEIGGKEITSTTLTTFVGTLTDKLSGLDGAIKKAKEGDYQGTIEEIAQAMSAATGTSASAWNTLLTTIGEKLPDAYDATLDDKGQTAAFLEAAAAAADDLGGEYPKLWEDMLSVLGEDAGAAISALAGGATAAAALQGLANGANALKTDVDVDKWKNLLTALSTEGKIDIAAGAGKSIEDLAKALASNDPGERGQAWSNLLGALYANIDNLSALTGKDAEGVKEWLDGIAESAANLSADDAAGWSNLLGELRKGLPNLQNASDWRTLLNTLKTTGGVNFDNVTGGIASLAEALDSNDPGEKAEAWKALLGALAADAESLSALTGQNAEGTKAWLQTLAQGVDSIDPNDASAWSNLLSQLITGLPGLEGMGFDGLFDDLNGEVDDSERYLRALGYNTDEIADKQAAWLEVCRRLVQTIPGLSEIINTETGEVKGGTEAIDEYVNAWVEGERKMALWSAHFAKGEALNQIRGQEYVAELDKITAEQRVKQNREKMDAILEKYGFGDEQPYEFTIPMEKARGISNEDFEAYNNLARERVELEADAAAAAANYERQVEDTAAAVQAYADEEAALTEQTGEYTVAAGEAAAATEELAYSQDEASAAINATTEALQAVETYYSRVRQESEKSIQSVVKGFETIETPAEQARQKMKDLTKQIDELNAAGKDSNGIQQTFSDIAASIPSVQNMTLALKDQLAYLEQYQNDLDAAIAKGVSEDILAILADGSVESADYLHALATQGSQEEIEALNEMYAQVEQRKQELAGNLTTTRLNADDEFQALVEAAQAAAEGLDVYSTAESAMESTVQGIADGIAAKVSAVQTQVDALNAALGGIGGGLMGFLGTKFSYVPKLAVGLDYVPFDNYLAQLHEGESVLTAEEAKVWRDFKAGGASVANTIDYDAMGGLMRENIKPGGNVYLDGRIVGQVISQQQGNSLRSLERSGWQR